ncbi:MAG: hypothetical protein P8P45_04435, partial [Flavobacteriales bacterium]|nr:hypothetical protein [Flavobacteriales bacterium]
LDGSMDTKFLEEAFRQKVLKSLNKTGISLPLSSFLDISAKLVLTRFGVIHFNSIKCDIHTRKFEKKKKEG